MTLREAYWKGYKPDYSNPKWCPGYISRRTTEKDLLDKPLSYAPKKKAYYFEMPSFTSTNYHHRIYLYKEN